MARRTAVRLCLEKYPPAIGARDESTTVSQTVLHLACNARDRSTYEIDHEVVRMLVARDPTLVCEIVCPIETQKGEEIGLEREEGEEIFSTPLHFACRCRPSLEVIKGFMYADDPSMFRRAISQRDGIVSRSML